LPETFRRFVILVSIRSCRIHLSTLSDFAGTLQVVDALKGRNALITGGGSGIGFAIAQAFVAAGANVVIASRNEERITSAVGVLRRNGGSAKGVIADVRDAVAVQMAVDTAIADFGALDIVIAISTTRALQGWAGCAHAAAAKAGVMSLIRTLAIEWGADGILCNTIAPGPVAGTEGVKRLYEDSGEATSLTDGIPLGRLGASSDIANAALYLCSDVGSFVTGTDLVVDGGRSRL
jgi:NAD(P)-dependent dehydrogenase (short-subunit alcohol dehydrogenase family)